MGLISDSLGGAIVPVVHMSAPPFRAGPTGARKGGEASDCGPTGATRPPAAKRQKDHRPQGDSLERLRARFGVAVQRAAHAPLPHALREPERLCRRRQQKTGLAVRG